MAQDRGRVRMQIRVDLEMSEADVTRGDLRVGDTVSLDDMSVILNARPENSVPTIKQNDESPICDGRYTRE